MAKALQGNRIPRGANFSDSLPDVIADSSNVLARSNGIIFAECKYSQSNPWVPYVEENYNNKILKAGKDKEEILLFDLSDIHLLSNPKAWIDCEKLSRSVPGYMYANIKQSKGYINICKQDTILIAVIKQMTKLSSLSPELPLVVMAQRYKKFRLAYVALDDLLYFYTQQNDRSYWSF